MASFEREILISCVARFLAVPGPARAAQSNRDLEGIRKKIENEKKSLSQLQVKEGSVLQTLSKIQTDLEKRRKELSLATTKLASLADELRAQESEAERVGDSISRAAGYLAKTRGGAVSLAKRAGVPLMIFKGSCRSELLHRRNIIDGHRIIDRELVANLQDETSIKEKLERASGAQDRLNRATQKKLLSLAQGSVRKTRRTKINTCQPTPGKNLRLRALREMEEAAQRLQKMMDEIATAARCVKPRQLPCGVFDRRGAIGVAWEIGLAGHGSVSAPFGKYQAPGVCCRDISQGHRHRRADRRSRSERWKRACSLSLIAFPAMVKW